MLKNIDMKCQLYNAKPQTNADRIRAMSDEEIAKVLISFFSAGGALGALGAETSFLKNKLQEVGEWLKQPAEEET